MIERISAMVSIGLPPFILLDVSRMSSYRDSIPDTFFFLKKAVLIVII